MPHDEAWQLLEAAPIADEPVWLAHARGFSSSFVFATKRERWTTLLCDRPRRIGEDSHKLHSDLDRRKCRLVSDLPASIRGTGVFYRFFDSPRMLPAEQAVAAAGSSDAIFSLIPGRLAVYFFHEGEFWLCEQP